MPDENDGIGRDAESPPTPAAPRAPRYREPKPPPMPMFEKAGWAILITGMLVLVFFALTRST